MKPFLIAFATIFYFNNISCNLSNFNNSLPEKFIGEWTLDEMKISILNNNTIKFEVDTIDIYPYTFSSKDSIVTLYPSQENFGKKKSTIKILNVSKNLETVIVQHSLFNKKCILLKKK